MMQITPDQIVDVSDLNQFTYYFYIYIKAVN